MNTKLTIEQSLEKAILFQKSGMINKAKVIYEDILNENETNFKACFELGDCYEKIKDYNKALFYFKKASKLNSKCYVCHLNMSKIYEKLSKFEFSLFHLDRVVSICPDFYEALFLIAQCYRKMKNESKMIEYLNKTLSKLPKHPGANHLLASINKEIISEFSSEYAEDLFDRYAGHFEEHLVSSLKYQVPFIIKEKLELLNLSNESKVLDLGCGTGLLGKTIIKQFSNIVGVDISTNMIEETRKKDIYSKLYIKDISDFLSQNTEKFDLIIAADVFIYIGNIETIFNYVEKSISSDGYFIFTVELSLETNIKDFQLAKSGRFSHDISYIVALCKNIGFEIVEKEEIILREENKIGQKGVIFILKKLVKFDTNYDT
ncbi:hypothetical protein CRV08_05450 [Halarcobacter ebronensis]|uniref:beta-lactamase n=1 Tax=Halarcobacter ebronensis TaxID=1462615 RepID=A0A4Q0YGS6_9BACT|nr:methyltransferase domain-containing protein [Halarcobacter ebronensis]RXJ68884.1 hypothetical protein CRV08_05450 [Halarcobacter ebronensis]